MAWLSKVYRDIVIEHAVSVYRLPEWIDVNSNTRFIIFDIDGGFVPWNYSKTC